MLSQGPFATQALPSQCEVAQSQPETASRLPQAVSGSLLFFGLSISVFWQTVWDAGPNQSWKP